MRTKFNLLATLLMVVLCVGFTSCSDDDEEEKQGDRTLELLVGTWEYTHEWSNINGGTDVVVYTYKFNADKSYTYTEMSDTSFGDYEENGTYQYYSDTKKLVLTDNGESYSVVLLEISKDKLKIDNDGDVEEYTRKK